ncbi:MAG: hypothetical protein ACRC9X_04295 [Bacteroidales bacterium]
MKNLAYIVLALCICHSTQLSAQNRKANRGKQELHKTATHDSICASRDKERNEQMKAQRVGYFTTMLDLTAQEAQVFWVVYNEFSDKRDALHCLRREIMRKIRREKLEDKTALQLVENMLQNIEDMLQLQREYKSKFAAILSPQKLLKYYAAEESFKTELLNKLRKNHPNGNSPHHKSME